MHLLRMATVCAVAVMAAAQSRCDPLTQYEESGRCCKMCGPGTRMSGRGTCLDPQCKECGENEYQDKFTTEEKCQLQPYCDTNKNFQYVAGESKKIRKTCTCAPGFHCSSAACITCVPHTVCKPGHGAQSIGNHTHDTVCQTCPKGTFSKESSWESVCKKWTECGEGYHIKHSGTDTSDNTCEETSRQHTVLIALISVFVLAVVVAGLIFCQCRGDAKRKLKDCVQSCRGERLELQNENPLIAPPVDDAEKELMFPEQQSSQEEGGTRTPEENEDELSEEISAGVILTDNGNYVTQEKGKTEILSRQESETQTFAD
ncbi:tumor necrosis factor receptor superfamily member 5 [Xiphias gladius]|uniref:tumor necrosis factor receptor superfamily member 5 n=1 Tax=Xiphias gladius TaxID=8245 RepID=UPI001A98691E|nr:tumor necrosis factor receptor superfamily member 5 [Xiphias gladius]